MDYKTKLLDLLKKQNLIENQISEIIIKSVENDEEFLKILEKNEILELQNDLKYIGNKIEILLKNHYKEKVHDLINELREAKLEEKEEE